MDHFIIPRSKWGKKVDEAWARLTGRLDVFVHHSVTAMPSRYFDLLYVEQHAKDGMKRRVARQQCVEMEQAHVKYLDNIGTGLGFSGVSYNFIVFPSGRTYEGRGFGYMGAHNDGDNATSIGVVAVGNYETERPTKYLVTGIVHAIKIGISRKKLRRRRRIKIRPHGAAYPGGTDATACPGRYLAAKLPEIRRRVRRK